MRTVALISGGKDSCFNMMSCVAEGHDIVALANLRPHDKDELDSYMYQTVGHHAIHLYADAMDLPLYTRVIKGSSVCRGRDYIPQDEDEVEDLFILLAQIKSEREIEAVSVGAILSDYQRVRVENVCQRLGLKVLSFLWRRDQEELLKEMIACHVKAIIIKVAAMGLLPKAHLGLELSEILPHMLKMKNEYGLNVCGEGGEYETFVFDCPLFKKSIIIEEKELITHSDDAFAPVAYLNLKKCHLQSKFWNEKESLQEKILRLPITTSSLCLNRHLCSEVVNSLNEENESERDSSKDIVKEIVFDEDTEHLMPSIHSNGINFQVAGIKAVVSDEVDASIAARQALNSLISCVQKLGFEASEITSMSLYVQNMSDFASINCVYNSFFKLNPPVRLCIQACLPANIALQLDCQGQRHCEAGRLTMHVQSLSHWAPANIGPYSQAVLIGGKLFMAGIIPLVPSTLAVINGGIMPQCKMSLIYVNEVLTAMSPSSTLTSCPLVMCFVTCWNHIDIARETWRSTVIKKDSDNGEIVPMVKFCVVPRLPKNVLVEWQVYVWQTDNEVLSFKRECLFQRCMHYTLTLECISHGDHFSCCINAVSTKDSLERINVDKMAYDILVQFLSLQDQGFNLRSSPLAKIFFPVSTFRQFDLQNAFSRQLVFIGKEEFPALSFIPINSLESSCHILLWCQ